MKKYIAILGLFLFLTGVAAAQNEKNDPLATRILNKMKTKYDGYLSLETKIKLIIKRPESKTEIMEGLMIQSGDKYRIELGNRIILCDGELLWTVMKQEEIVQLSEAKTMEDTEDNLIMSPKDLMKMYEKGKHLYALTHEGKENGKTIQQIEFKPLDEGADYFKIRLTLDKADSSIQRLKIFSRDGSRYTLDVSKPKTNKAYPSQKFKYDNSICPDCDIEDVRID